MSVTSGENREAAALAETLTSQAAQPTQQETTVPLHVVQAMREELKGLKEKNEAFTNHIQMMQWQQQSAPPPAPYNPFQGKDPKDSILVEDAARMVSEMEHRTQSQLAEIKMAAKTPDYEDVIKKYLPKAALEDPDLIAEIKTSANPYKTAYLAAKASKAYQEDLMSSYRQKTNEQPPMKPKADPEAEKLINNAKQSGNLSSVANNSSPTGQYPEFGRMTDDEFRQYKGSVKFKTQRR